MIEAIVRLRTVSADAIWAYFISDRTIAPSDEMPAVAATQVKMLLMWRSDDVCYARLESEIAALGADNRFGPVVYRQYLDYIDGRLSPCLDERLPLVDAQQFFDGPAAVRTERIDRWFNASWYGLSEESRISSTEHCNGIFDAHLPDAISATDAEQLSAIWSTALNQRFRCQFEGMNHANQLSDLGDAHLFTLSEEERSKIVTLQMTLLGHVIAIGLGRPYEECWPPFQAGTSVVAAATGSGQLNNARNMTLEQLYGCVEQLPATNPFSPGQ